MSPIPAYARAQAEQVSTAMAMAMLVASAHFAPIIELECAQRIFDREGDRSNADHRRIYRVIMDRLHRPVPTEWEAP